MKNKIKLFGLLTVLLLSIFTAPAQERVGYYYNYQYQTDRFQDMTGQDITSYGISAALDNSVKRDSLAKQMKRYRLKYPTATIKCVITDTATVTKIINFQNSKSVTFDGYNLEREFWNGTGTFAQWQTYVIYIKQRLGSVEAYLGRFSQSQADSIVKYCDRIYLHNYYNIDRWSGKYCIDNDVNRVKYLAKAANRWNNGQGKVFEVLLLLANNEQSNTLGFQTEYLSNPGAITYCWQSYQQAYTNYSIPYKLNLLIKSVMIYKKS